MVGNTLDFEFKDYVILSHPIGSRYVCDPPVLDTDRDTLILVHSFKEACNALLNEGWTPCGNGEYIEGAFKAYRLGEDNYVVTENAEYFNRYLIAAQVCKAFNIQQKEARIKVHQTCLEASGGCIGLIDWDHDKPVWTMK